MYRPKSPVLSYIDSILNKSPSKAAYSFNKSDRFETYKPIYGLNCPQSQCKLDLSPSNVSPRNKKTMSKSFYNLMSSSPTKPSQNNNYADFVKNTFQTFEKNKSHLEFSRSPKKNVENPVNRETRYAMTDYTDKRLLNQRKNMQQIRENKEIKTRDVSRSYEKMQKSLTPTKTENKVIKSSFKSPEKNRLNTMYNNSSPLADVKRTETPSGFYPVNLEIKTLRIPISTIKNPESYSFGSKYRNLNSQAHVFGPAEYNVSAESPGKYFESKSKSQAGARFSKEPKFEKIKNNIVGPGKYKIFSEFGSPV